MKFKNIISVLLIAFILVVCGLSLIYSWDESLFWKNLDIKPNEIPIYPNAQSITQEEPILDGYELYRWSFITNDTPDKVWSFYADKMSNKWGFYDTSSEKFNDHSLVVKSCPFYHLSMTDTSIDDKTYKIFIEFGKEPCR